MHEHFKAYNARLQRTATFKVTETVLEDSLHFISKLFIFLTFTDYVNVNATQLWLRTVDLDQNIF